MSVAPVALFAYRRPAHLKRVIDALLANPQVDETDLYAFVDGPKTASDAKEVEEVRNLLSSIRGFKSVKVHVSPTNLGLSSSILHGIDSVLSIHDRIIVLEDDVLVAPGFLAFMNSHLDLYEHEDLVASINAYCYVPEGFAMPETFFIRGAAPWGWATWRRAWETHERCAQTVLNRMQERGVLSDFDYGGVAPLSQLLKERTVGRNESWDVVWAASCFLNSMLTLFPSVPLAVNIGQDGSGTHNAVHSSSVQLFRGDLTPQPIPVWERPETRKMFSEYWIQRNPMRRTRLGQRIDSNLRRLYLSLPQWIRKRIVRSLRPVQHGVER